MCRIVRNGWRCEQTSNQYEILPSAVPPVPACDRHRGGETRKIEIPCWQPSAAEVAAAQIALAQRRAVVEARLLGNKSLVATA
jgi:hypothetical protein